MAAKDNHGFPKAKKIYRNLSVPCLVEQALKRGEGVLSDKGALDVNTGRYTGRSPLDKFIVDCPEIHDEIGWGEINRPIGREAFESLKARLLDYISDKELFVFDGIAGADSRSSLNFRIVNEAAYQNLFIRQLLIRPTEEQLQDFHPDYTVLCVPGFKCSPERDGVHSETAIIIDFVTKTVLIAGNSYCGEIKKAVFTVANYELPKRGILTMHCSANIGRDGDTALFFGLSGTGKTTLSSQAERALIGDDEHGWSDSGVFNLEGGCYAKCIDLDPKAEPMIFEAIRFGTVLENVILDSDGHPDYRDHSLTYNTRAGYPVDFIQNASESGIGSVPKTVIFLTADAYGVVPPISRLSHEDALFHYLSGYTSKVSGTELGISEPVSTFSSMFGEPFFPLKTEVYCELMLKKLRDSGAKVYLVNTGWCGAQAGSVPRIKLRFTRAMVDAAISGKLDDAVFTRDEALHLEYPDACPGVPQELLCPQKLWLDKAQYIKQRQALADSFGKNFDRKFAALALK